jgi:hypothetical protein
MKKIKMDAEEEERRRHSDAEKKRIVRNWKSAAEETAVIGNQFFICMVFLSIVLTFACTPRSFEKPNAAATPPPSTAEDRQANFQNELEKMKTANLQYVFVFRRKDGGAFDGEDKRFLRGNLPFNNRVVLADEDKAVIVGSNYKFPPDSLGALLLRFNVEDYSAAEAGK